MFQEPQEYPQNEIVDVTEYFQTRYSDIKDYKVLKAERKGTETLVLAKLDYPNNCTVDPTARRNRFEVTHRWHKDCQSPLSSVQGSDVNYLTFKEVKSAIVKTEPKHLFDILQVF